MNNYVYEVGDNLYINLTNKCSNSCFFCIRNGHDGMNGKNLWVDKEPTAQEIIDSLQHPEYLFSKPDIFIRELMYAYMSRENFIHVLFSGSRTNMLLIRTENSLKDIIFSLRPDYKENITANVLFTLSIYGGFYAFEKCRSFGEDSVIDILSEINQKIMELLR